MSDAYITLYVAASWARLGTLTGKPPLVLCMSQALHFLDSWLDKRYKDFLQSCKSANSPPETKNGEAKQTDKDCDNVPALTPMIVMYLYTRTSSAAQVARTPPIH